MKASHILAAFALTASVALGAAACSSSSDSSSGTTGSCSTGGGSSTTSPACTSCMQAKCSTQYSACFGSGGSCSAWVSGGCKTLPDATCQSCITPLSTCETSNCKTECTSSADAGPTDTGGGLPDVGDLGGCTALASCCPSLPASAIDGCSKVAAAGDNGNCNTLIASVRAGGFCK